LREVPAQVRKRVVLPHPDEGIDLIACTRHGEYWAIQSKFRSQRDQPLTRRELGTFTSLAFNTCRNIALAVVAHTCTRPVSKRHLMRDTVEIGLDRWQSLDWGLIVGSLKGKAARPKVRHPRPHQVRAISAAYAFTYCAGISRTCRSRKSHPARIRAARQNKRIILRDARIPSAAVLSPTCSGRGAGLKSRTSFFAISSILL